MIARMIALLHRRRRLMVAVTLLALVSALYAAPGQKRIDSLNFYEAEISIVIKALADMSGTNIVVSPEVKGPISLSLRDVTVDQALQVITGMTGCTVQTTNGVYLINKGSMEKKTEPVKPAVEKKSAVVYLQSVTAEEVISALGVACPDVQAKALQAKRLILSGEAKSLDTARTFIAELDDPALYTVTSAGVDTVEASYQVKAVVPQQAKQYLDDLYRGQGLNISFAPNLRLTGEGMSSYPKSPIMAEGKAGEAAPVDVPTPGVQWVSDKLVLRGPRSVVGEALISLQRIDIEVPIAKQRCRTERIFATQAITYLLDQFESRGLAIVSAPMTFTAAADKGEAAKDGNRQIGTRIMRDKDGRLNVTEPIGDFILMGTEDIVKEAMAELAKIDVGPERVERVYSLRFLQVNEAKERLLELYGGEGLLVTVAPAMRGDTPAMASDTGEVAGAKVATGDAATMKVFDIVLRGPETVVVQAEELLRQLDVESMQISIQSEFISVDKSEMEKIGIDWPGSITTKLTELPSGDPLKLGRITRDPISLSATINLLETKNKAKIISRPSTVVQNGREAVIHVGDQILYETLAGFDNGTPIFTTTQVDAGVTLQVLPQMSKDGIITLQITSVVSELVKFNTGASGAQLPQIRETKSATSVQVRDGETLVIGGLTMSRLIVEKKGVPVLGNLPLIGGLFSTKTTTPSESDLLILVTPRAIKSLLQGAATPVVTPSATTAGTETPK